MKTRRSFASFVGIPCLILSFLSLLLLCAREKVVGARDATASAQASADIVAAAEKDPCQIKNQPGGGPLRSFGCGVLFYLATRDILSPASENYWYTKCDLNALLCAAGEKQVPVTPPKTRSSLSGANGGTLNLSDMSNANALLIKLLRSAKLPVQLADDSAEFARDQASSPTFASILFNSLAATAMKAADGTPRSNVNNATVPIFPPGSVIAKIVWGVYPMDDKGRILEGTEAFASAMSYSQQDSWTNDEGKANGFTLPNARIPGMAKNDLWTTPQFTQDSFGADCGRALKYPTNIPFAPDCMYLIDTIPQGPNAATARAVLNSDSLSGTAIGTGADCKDKPCKVVLLGIHLMVRLSDSDPIRQGRPDPLRIASPWVFITFWWTGKGDGLCSANRECIPKPWNNYQMNITQDFRDDGGPGQPMRNICYNPYLEGFKQHGAATNCVHCHYYAAYKESDGTSLVGIGGSQMIGFAAPPSKTRYPAKAGCASNADYNNFPGVSGGVVCTDFVWSVANMIGSPQK